VKSSNHATAESDCTGQIFKTVKHVVWFNPSLYCEAQHRGSDVVHRTLGG